MIRLAVRFGDLSILPHPLSWQDVFDIEAETAIADKIDRMKRLVFQDIDFYLHRLSVCFTGSEGMDFLPSHIADMEYKMEQRAKEKAQGN